MAVRTQRYLPLLVSGTLLFGSGCSQSSGRTPQIHLIGGGSTQPAFIEVSGLSSAERDRLARPAITVDEWQRVLLVAVKSPTAGAHPVAVAGKYSIDGTTLRFTPFFPFDPGREYEVRFYGVSDRADPIVTTVALPAPPAAPPTYVTGTYPSGGQVPANQLRMYIHFSAPMGRRGGVDHVRLLDDRGREVEAPFLPLDAEFWNADRTRYTVFFDPGRQKRGILPNRQLGPSLVPGRSYTLVVDGNWIDANGKPLREEFTRQFSVGPPDNSPLDYAAWRISAPLAGTRDPLSVTFPEPLDHALLMRAIGVKRDGQSIIGTVRVQDRERRWTMIPSEEWRAGRYDLVALSFLEDLAGNRIGRAFEVDAFTRPAAAEPESAVTSIPFTVLPVAHGQPAQASGRN